MANNLHKWVTPILLVVLVTMGTVQLPAQCNPCNVNTSINKIEAWYFYPGESYTSYVVPGKIQTSFVPGRTAVIAPFSKDPGTVTVNPIILDACTSPQTTPNGIQGCQTTHGQFRSLRDIGTWTITITEAVVCYTEYTAAQLCGFQFDPNYAAISNQPSVLIFNVSNDPPTGKITYFPQLTSSPADWGKTITFDGNGSDPDGGEVLYSWSIVERPPGSQAHFTTVTNIRNPTIAFNNQADIGKWHFKVDIDDDEGERKTFDIDLVVPNVKPDITLNVTPGNTMDVLQTLNVSATPVNDVDGNEPFVFNWEVKGPHAYSGALNTSAISFVTNESDITTYSDGTDFRPVWNFTCTAKDNEGDADTQSAQVHVKNKPPVIKTTFEKKIKAGSVMNLSTSVLDDEDGGALSFVWDIIQAPVGASIGVKNAYSKTSSVTIPTTAAFAGTWRFKLTATDNEGEKKSEEYAVLVDAPPVANITGPNEPVGTFTGFPLTLDGSTSEDPDSRETCPDHCHTTSQPPIQVSPGITGYTWFLLDAPEDNPDIFAKGRVDEVLGIDAGGSKLDIPFDKRLTPGFYTFQLKVEDGEGNVDTKDFTVEVVKDESNPLAIILPPFISQLADAADNKLPSSIAFTAFSADPDNLVNNTPGSGITNYEWLVLTQPPGCPVVPVLPSGASASSITLFPSGAIIDPACQGLWQIGLKVTDDDNPPMVNEPLASAIVVIGNCPASLCIDYPTTQHPQLVQFSDKTDVTILFHLNSALYGNPLALLGTIARIQIFYEKEVVPFFTALDPNLYPSNLGGKLMFHWNGYGVGNARPKAGNYHIKITLLDQMQSQNIGEDYQADAIQIEVAVPAIDAASDKYIDRGKLQNGTDKVTIQYNITGGSVPDVLSWKVYDAGNAVVKQGNIPTPPDNGSMEWDGINDAAVLVPPGAYEMELETWKGAASIGKSKRYTFYIFQTDIDADVNRDGAIDNTTDDIDEHLASLQAGALFNVNYDRDGSRTVGGNNVGDAIYINDKGVPGYEDIVIDNAEDMKDITPFVIRKVMDKMPASFHVYLKAGSLEDIQSVHVFKKISAGEKAIWGGLGSRVPGAAAIPTEIDITPYVDPANSSYQGDAAGDIRFGLEGLFFRNTGSVNTFDGEVDFTLEVRDGSTVVASDVIALKVAPWLMVSHAQASKEVWVGGYDENSSMRETAKSDAGYVGLDKTPGQMKEVTEADAGTQWLQDHVEIGYYQRPGGLPEHCIFRLPYQHNSVSSQPIWPEKLLLGAGTATFQLQQQLAGAANSGDFGGNLELLPPNTKYKNGRIVNGSRSSTELYGFLQDQEAQKPFSINTDWLKVGHVDEIFGFTGNTNEVVIADPVDAYTLLNAIPVTERGKSVFFATGATPVEGTVVSANVNNNRINTGIDHTTGPAWRYVRIYRATTSGAQGQIAQIAAGGLHNGYIDIDTVWNTGSQILPDTGNTYGRYMNDALDITKQWVKNPAAGDRFVLVEDSRCWRQGSPAIITVEEVLADTLLYNLNTTEIQKEIAIAQSNIQTAAEEPVNFIKVPVIYLGTRVNFLASQSCEAFNPGLANFQPVSGSLFFPRQFGPRDKNGKDIFEEATRQRVPNAVFTDDWDKYHRLLGEVHCGTNARREFPAFNWW